MSGLFDDVLKRGNKPAQPTDPPASSPAGVRLFDDVLQRDPNLPPLPPIDVPVEMSGNGDIPLRPQDREVGRIYTDKRGQPRRWMGDSWAFGDAARETTPMELFEGGYNDLIQGTTRAPEALIDLGFWVNKVNPVNNLARALIPGYAAREDEGKAQVTRYFNNARAAYEQFKPEAYKAEQAKPIVSRDAEGSITGIGLPSGEQLLGTTMQTLPQIPQMIVGGGGARNVVAKVLPEASPLLQSFLGYGTANSALVAPNAAEQARVEALDAGATPEQASSAANTTMALTAPLTFATGGAGEGTSAVLGHESRNLLSALFRGFLADAPTEAIEESGQSVIGDIAQGRQINAANALEQGILAGIAGGTSGSAVAGSEHIATPHAPSMPADIPIQPQTAAAPAAPAANAQPADPNVLAELDRLLTRNVVDEPAQPQTVPPPAAKPVAPPAATKPAAPPSYGPNGLAPVESVGKNYRAPLKNYTPTLFRETSPERAMMLMPDSGVRGDEARGELFFANTRDGALGQGGNAGVLLEFDSDGIDGNVNRDKPAWEAAWNGGLAEFRTRGLSEAALHRALKSVTVKPDANIPARFRRTLDTMLSRGWSEIKNEDGSTTYSRDAGVGPAIEKTIAPTRRSNQIPVRPRGEGGRPLDLLEVIANSGGLDREAWVRAGVDPAETGRRVGFGYLFRREGGMTPDDLREMMQENGYLPRDSETGVATVDNNDAIDLVDRALRGGEKIYSEDQGDAVARYRATQRADDEAYREEADRAFMDELRTSPEFAPPTAREQVAAREKAVDAERNGLGRDAVPASRGDGELFAGPRPEQQRIDPGAMFNDYNPNASQIESRVEGDQVITENRLTRRILDATLGDADSVNAGLLLDNLSLQPDLRDEQRDLARRLAPVLKRLKVKLTATPEGASYAGAYDNGSNSMWILQADPDTVLHEGIHGATSALIASREARTNPTVRKAVAELEDMRAHLRMQVAMDLLTPPPEVRRLLDDRQGPLSNAKELIAYSMTEKPLQEWLATVPAPPGREQSRNVWQAFKDTIAKLFNLSGKTRSYLDALIETTGELIDFAGANPDVAQQAQAEVSGRFSRDPQRAFHGTPHKVDRFSTDRIGTGEGNQMYGWGLYFASLKKVGDYYRGGLGKASQKTQEVRPNAIEALKRNDILGFDTVQEALGAIRADPDFDQSFDIPDPKDVEALRAYRNSFGNLYQVEVPENDDLLDWDATLAKQPPKVREKLAQAFPEYFRTGWMGSLDGMPAPDAKAGGASDERLRAIGFEIGNPSDRVTGQQFYRAIAANANGENHRAASKMLNDIGIPGLRYLDQLSRAGGQGTHNFVVWDDAVIGDPTAIDAARLKRTASTSDQGDAVATSTAAFRKWFGKSKVVDANGNPRIVYHGANAKFDAFDPTKIGTLNGRSEGPGFYFTTDKSVAKMYEDRAADGALYEVYLRIEKPMRYDHPALSRKKVADLLAETARQEIATDEDLDDWRDGFLANYVYTPDFRTIEAAAMEAASMFDGSDTALDQISGIIGGGVPARTVNAAVQKTLGFDGYVSTGFSNAGSAENTIYVAMRPEQVKSANNRGTFDPADERMDYARIKRTPEQEAAMTKAGMPADGRSTAQRSADALRSAWAKVRDAMGTPDSRRQSLVDRFHGLRAAEAQMPSIAPEESPYIAARLTTGLPSVMESIMTFGAPKWDNGVLSIEPGTTGLLDALKPVANDLDAWLGWMVGRRAKLLKAQGRENLFTDDDIDALLSLSKGRDAEFASAARDYLKIKNAILDVAEQAGLIDPVARAAWDHAEYVPFYRDDAGDTVGPGTRKGLEGQTSGIRTLKGGDANLSDPMANIIRNFTKLVDASMKNRAMLLAVDKLGASMFKKAGPDFSPALIPMDQVKKTLIAQGVPQSVISGMPASALKGVQSMLSIKPPSGDDIVRVMRNGKAEYYQVADPIVLRALTAFRQQTKHPAVQPLIFAKRLLTTGVTTTAEFVGANFIRDTAATWVIGDKKIKLGIDAANGVVRTLMTDQATKDMMAGGGSFIGGNFYGGDPDATAAALRRSLRARGLRNADIETFVGTVARSPLILWDKWHKLSSAIENANRNAVYRRALQSGKPKVQAVYEAKDLMDFSMIGDSQFIQFFADVLPFFNARVQGLYKLGRAAADPKARRQIAARGAMIALASVALWYWNITQYGDGYDELEEWDKDTYWHIAPGTRWHIRIPKPFEIGVLFATAPERMAQAISGNDRSDQSWESLWRNLTGTLAMNPIPQAFLPIIEQWANRRFFTGRPIESMSDEKLLPEAREEWFTSDTMKLIADAVGNQTGASAKRLEHLWTGYTAGLGTYVLDASDWLVRKAQNTPSRPSMTPSEIPVLGRFWRGDEQPKNTRYVTEFYDLREQMQQVSGTIKEYIDNGKPEKAERLKQKYAWLLGDEIESKRAKGGIMFANVREMEKMVRTLGEQRRDTNDFIEFREATPAEKRDAVDDNLLSRNSQMRFMVRKLREAQRQQGASRK